MRLCQPALIFACLNLLYAQWGAAAEPKVDELLNQAQAAQLKGDRYLALSLVNKAIETDPKNPQCYYVRGRLHVANREHTQAIADLDRVLQSEPRAAEVYQLRGAEHFKLGHFVESIADFDKFLEFAPQQRPHHWQRGISCYYAGRYEEGRKQFEAHQTVNSNDVENAVWHYLCVARAAGVEKARASLLKIKEDPRVPMMQIHALFAGQAKPEDVLAAARKGTPSPAQTNQQLFYAHLYIGLYYEAAGDEKMAREHITQAAKHYSVNHYMGEVARVHAELLAKKAK